MKIDWKKMGFKTEEEYHNFLAEKYKSLKLKFEQPEINSVFKRLANK